MTGEAHSRPYGLMADCHLHNWSQFASVDEDGNNTRLIGLLDEMQRCVDVTASAGGNVVYIAGDLFHVRGSIKPSVFNLTYSFFAGNPKVTFVMIAGNHDLETKIASDSSSALTALGALSHVTVVNDAESPYVDDNVIAIPWIENVTVGKIRDILDGLAVSTADKDLILHTPISGVFRNISEGLDPAELSELPVRRVFSGHFHSYKCWDFPRSPCRKVVSVGSIAQHNFGEAENGVGWLVVTENRVVHERSGLPMFATDLYTSVTEEAYRPLFDVYLRVVVDADVKPSELEKTKAGLLEKSWCRGVVFQTVPRQTGRISGHCVESGSSLEVSVSEYVSKMTSAPAGLDENCQRLLREILV